MELYILLEKGQGRLEIRADKTVVGFEAFTHDRDLGTRLIETLDSLLKKTTIDLASISSYSLESMTGPDSTASRIAQAFIEGLKLPPDEV